MPIVPANGPEATVGGAGRKIAYGILFAEIGKLIEKSGIN